MQGLNTFERVTWANKTVFQGYFIEACNIYIGD